MEMVDYTFGELVDKSVGDSLGDQVGALVGELVGKLVGVGVGDFFGEYALYLNQVLRMSAYYPTWEEIYKLENYLMS